MNKVQGLKRFLENEVLEETKDFQERLLGYVNANKKEVIEGITASFQEACKTAGNMPGDILGKAEYVQFTLSRCDALLRQDFYKVELFDKKLYAGGFLCQSSLTADWMYKEFFRFCDCILERSKQYIGQIGKIELERIYLSALESSQKLLKYLIKEALEDMMETEEYANLPEAAAFHLSIYRGPFQVIYVKDTKKEQWKEYLNELLQNLPGYESPQPDTAHTVQTGSL